METIKKQAIKFISKKENVFWLKGDVKSQDKAVFYRSELKKMVEDLLDHLKLEELIKDQKRIDWLEDGSQYVGNVQLPTGCVQNNPYSLRGGIDDAMVFEKEISKVKRESKL